MAGMMAWEPVARGTGLVLRVVATVWMAWVLAGLVWLAGGHNTVRLSAPAVTERRAAPVVDVSRLAALDLFGAAPLAPATGEAASAPDTSLQLRLTGVFVNPDAGLSSAIVGERNNPSAPARVYRVNEALPGGATLAEVYDDRILIRRGEGAAEVLRFEKTSLLAGDASSAGTERETGNTGVRDMLGNAMQAMAAAPEEFVREMGLKPGDNGYEVTAQTPENMRTAIGLQPGDRIVSINGRRLGNPRRDRNVLGELHNGSGRVKVEIQRGGQTVTLERKL
jgi:general secretion pathway protein C